MDTNPILRSYFVFCGVRLENSTYLRVFVIGFV